jgi:hypothetical protein
MERQSFSCLIAAMLLSAGASAWAAGEPPSAAEIEFWRSTERLGTPEAYRAYLAAFPNGLYVPLARAALGTPAPAAPAAPAAKPGATTLRYFSEPADETGAINFNIGDRFSGPGALNLGRLGARRQMVLPEGDWVVLAGTDWRAPFPYNLRSDRLQVAMSTVVFGKFAGDRLVTMLRYTANTRPTPNLGSNTLSWNWADYVNCDANNTTTRLFQERTRPNASRDECLSIWVAPDPLSEPWPGNEQAKANVSRIGGNTSGAAIVTTLSFAEQPRYGYLGIVRVDWPNLAGSEQAGAWQPDEVAAVPARRAFVKSLRDWASEYRKAALEGFRRDYPGEDLKPVTSAR